MINEKETTHLSKFISLVLCHKPETIGLKLDDNGWADCNELINKLNNQNTPITLDILKHIVFTNNKKRFSFSEDGTKIRANQGHSIEVELNLKEAKPPKYLYHGTGEKFIESILSTGLEKRSRQHVHLSFDKETAITVGRRHGKVKVFIVATEQMKNDGYKFYLSENNVWLTDFVPVEYLELSKDK